MTIGRETPPDPYDRDDYDEWLDRSRPDGLEDVWRAVQHVLGSDGTVAGVARGVAPDVWIAYCSGPRGFTYRGEGPTPAKAMRDLLDELESMRRLETFTKGPPRRR